MPVSANGASRPDSTDVQYARLRREILSGEFAPGTVLLETALSARYGVSRTPVREALGRLAAEGLIERSTRGFRIKARKPEEILEIYEARIALESRCAELAAVRSSEIDRARLAYLLDERRSATDPAQFSPLNNKWHEALRSSAHNATIDGLLSHLDSLLLLLRPRTFAAQPDDRSAQEHAEILDAIARGDAAAAGALMTEHLTRMRDWRIRLLIQDGN